MAKLKLDRYQIIKGLLLTQGSVIQRGWQFDNSEKKIAKKMEVPIKTVMRVKDELIENGLIIVAVKNKKRWDNTDKGMKELERLEEGSELHVYSNVWWNVRRYEIE
jgi:predicted transcriptional regulator